VFTLQDACAADFESLLALRLRAMRESLEQLGRYDEQRARERLAAGFDPAHTRHIVVADQRVGFLVLKRLSHAMRLDHLYVDPALQRRGIGGAVLRQVCDQADAQLLPIELCALKGSAANRLYLQHGFVQTGEGEWDNDYQRAPLTRGLRAVRAWWAAVQARDWEAARAGLHAHLQAVWWTSGERFKGADAFVEVQSRYPEGWAIRLLEVSPLQDGRIVSVVRVDQEPNHFFATSFFRVDDGLIAAIEEYWATLEPPPAWRRAAPQPGWHRLDPLQDPRARQP
jgi:ribosomal protein S18 acetylase RimI-like enzyme